MNYHESAILEQKEDERELRLYQIWRRVVDVREERQHRLQAMISEVILSGQSADYRRHLRMALDAATLGMNPWTWERLVRGGAVVLERGHAGFIQQTCERILAIDVTNPIGLTTPPRKHC